MVNEHGKEAHTNDWHRMAVQIRPLMLRHRIEVTFPGGDRLPCVDDLVTRGILSGEAVAHVSVRHARERNQIPDGRNRFAA